MLPNTIPSAVRPLQAAGQGDGRPKRPERQFDRMNANSEKDTPQITLYTLHACGHCKDIARYLQDRRVAYRTVYVDMLAGEERNDTMRYLRRVNPAISFPTLTIDDEIIVGFKQERIAAALDAHSL